MAWDGLALVGRWRAESLGGRAHEEVVLELAEVATLSMELAAERKRLVKVERLAALLERSAGLAPTLTSWLSGELPQGKLGLGWAAIQKVIDAPDEGGAPLTVSEVDACFSAIAADAGSGSAGRKLGRFGGLIARAGPAERRLLLGLVTGELRQGALEGLLLSAVAKAFVLPEARVRRAAMLAGSLRTVVAALCASGPDGLLAFSVELMRPISPMLADTAEALSDAPLTELLLEPKLDGARVQIHKRGEEVRCFSRALNEVTAALPEVVEAVRAVAADALILDGEVIALTANGRPLPFQTTMRRFGRRLEVERVRTELPLTTFVFDLLHQDGVAWLDEPLEGRRRALEALLPSSGPLRVTPGWWRPSLETAGAVLEETLAAGHEGLMLKRLDAPYFAGQRGSHWLKLKPEKTLDLVVVAVEQGSGRRSGWLSNLHLAARDEADGETRWVMLGKTFKGMTDALLEWQTQELSRREVTREGHVVHVRPELVVEVAFQELEASPRYPGGVALRFARVKGYRPDKSPAQADTLQTVLALFRAQRGEADDSAEDVVHTG